ncbi:6619_t:CDS:2, partial [Paraglomus occultum]
ASEVVANTNYLTNNAKIFTIKGGKYRGVPVFDVNQTVGALNSVTVSLGKNDKKISAANENLNLEFGGQAANAGKITKSYKIEDFSNDSNFFTGHGDLYAEVAPTVDEAIDLIFFGHAYFKPAGDFGTTFLYDRSGDEIKAKAAYDLVYDFAQKYEAAKGKSTPEEKKAEAEKLKTEYNVSDPNKKKIWECIKTALENEIDAAKGANYGKAADSNEVKTSFDQVIIGIESDKEVLKKVVKILKEAKKGDGKKENSQEVKKDPAGKGYPETILEALGKFEAKIREIVEQIKLDKADSKDKVNEAETAFNSVTGLDDEQKKVFTKKFFPRKKLLASLKSKPTSPEVTELTNLSNGSAKTVYEGLEDTERVTIDELIREVRERVSEMKKTNSPNDNNDKDKPFYQTPLGIITIFACIALIVGAIVYFMKNNSSDEEEE